MSRSGLFAKAAFAGAIAIASQTAVAADPRLVSRPYDANSVVRIDGRAAVQANVTFNSDEHIENVAIGDSSAWQVTPNKRANILFIKPLRARARTNMTVVTDQRSYFFDLVADPAARAVYALRFTYPERAGAARGAAPAGSAAAPATASAPALQPAYNYAWQAKGKAQMAPARIYDDGTSLYLALRPDAKFPAILTRNNKGEEGPVNFAVREGTVVIEGVPDLVVLRAGKDMTVIERSQSARGRTAAAAPAQSPHLAQSRGN